MKKIKAFTLAEVLVTLGIIGVVSAMTVPTLMQNYQKKSYVTQLHKVYNELHHSIVQLMTD
uniref:prepilin-type N-terminal cleavage/methylation domain-containing protein n=1 Tax=Candidatus Stercorousia sp. TaxID=3048886 RepID=UPI0040269FDB